MHTLERFVFVHYITLTLSSSLALSLIRRHFQSTSLSKEEGLWSMCHVDERWESIKICCICSSRRLKIQFNVWGNRVIYLLILLITRERKKSLMSFLFTCFVYLSLSFELCELPSHSQSIILKSNLLCDVWLYINHKRIERK